MNYRQQKNEILWSFPYLLISILESGLTQLNWVSVYNVRLRRDKNVSKCNGYTCTFILGYRGRMLATHRTTCRTLYTLYRSRLNKYTCSMSISNKLFLSSWDQFRHHTSAIPMFYSFADPVHGGEGHTAARYQEGAVRRAKTLQNPHAGLLQIREGATSTFSTGNTIFELRHKKRALA